MVKLIKLVLIGVVCFFALVGVLSAYHSIGSTDEVTFEDDPNIIANEPDVAESVEKTSPKTCISSWDGQHIRMKRQIESLMKENGLTGFQHKYTGFNPPKASAGETVTMWTCFSAKKGKGRPVDMMVYYKTTVPKSSNIDTNDPNWCPVFDVKSQIGCE